MVIRLNFPVAVKEDEDFFGRREEIKRIEEVFSSGAHRLVTVSGERRMGKTSIMEVASSRLRRR